MNKDERGKMNMFILMSLFFTKYAALFAGYGQLILEIAGFKAVQVDLGLDFGVHK